MIKAKPNGVLSICRTVVVVTCLGVWASLANAPVVHAMGYASLTCPELWERKQEIYRDNAYCFKDPEAVKQFSNSGCRFKKLSDVGFPDSELSKLSLIARSEDRKKCPRATPLLQEEPDAVPAE